MLAKNLVIKQICQRIKILVNRIKKKATEFELYMTQPKI